MKNRNRFFHFKGITASVVSSREVCAKIIIYVPPETSGEKIFDAIKKIDFIIQRHMSRRPKKSANN